MGRMSSGPAPLLRLLPCGHQEEITNGRTSRHHGVSRVTSVYNGRVSNRFPKSASINACNARRRLAGNMPCVCDTFAAYDRQAFSKHCTNPLAEVGKQSDALPLFSRCHLATSRLPCGVLVPCGVQVHCALALGGCLTHPSTLPNILPASLGNRAI